MEEIPEDVLEDILEAMEEVKQPEARRGRARYPSNRDIAEAVIEAARSSSIRPEDFVDIVLSILEERGFSTRFVNEKRVWRIYENLVRRRIIRDTLGVVEW